VSAGPYVFMVWTATNLPLPVTDKSAAVQSCTCANDRPLSVLSECRVPKQNGNGLRLKVDKRLTVCVLLT
jgi:hypothetical protein